MLTPNNIFNREEGCSRFGDGLSAFMGLFLLFVLLPALIYIVLVLALGTTEQIALPACGKDLLTMLAQLQGTILVCQLEAEHHLNAQQQRMEIPNDGRLVEQVR